MKVKNVIGTALIAIAGGLIAVFVYSMVADQHSEIIVKESQPKVRYANLPPQIDSNISAFTYAAETSVNTVVHVKTKSLEGNYSGNPLYEFFFGDGFHQGRPRARVGYGSGVIVSSDGYIITNNHVIENSEEIEVILNDGRKFDASVKGTDPNTDLALLKIDAQNLPRIKYGNSDQVNLGEWVLAVGNPYNLTSTVTAGIISAKARDWQIKNNPYAINSFIQTDAAVNPGNSGGALVDLKGRLIGINTAIATQTGAYSGYAFAVPVNIVKKVVSDLIKYGQVQRALLGVSITEVDAELAEEEGLEKIEGVYIAGIKDDGAADEAGIQGGDVILAINGNEVNKTSELQEQISRYKPGDKVEVRIKRNGKIREYDVTLLNIQGTTSVVKTPPVETLLGAKLKEISESTKQKLGIRYGVMVTELSKGKLRDDAGVKKGFIITRINDSPVKSVRDIKQIIQNAQGGVYLEGIYPNGVVAYYAFGI